VSCAVRTIPPVQGGVMAELTLSDVLRKTSAGRQEQQQRSQSLSARHRHVLILCDGRRPLRELHALIGEEAMLLAAELHAAGLVEQVAPVAPAAAAPVPSNVVPTAVPAAQLAKAVAPPPKRSIALTRMYMLDMVERLLGSQSGPARAHLRAADSPQALIAALGECLALIAEVAGPTQEQKVRQQLTAMLPEDYLPAFSVNALTF